MLVGLQTAAQGRLPSPVQAEQGSPAPGDRTRIGRFPVGEQVEAVALCCAHRRRRLFSVLRPPPLASIARRGRPHGRISAVFLR
jgi:hypothetical protein